MEPQPFWLAQHNLRETRRRARILRPHGHAATPYPAEGCVRCELHVVTPRGVR
jgi:hypothetical protein